MRSEKSRTIPEAVSGAADQGGVRATLKRLAEERGESLAALSRMVYRNEAYLQQFIERGSPKRLPDDVRLLLAQFFQIDERELGARDPWMPTR